MNAARRFLWTSPVSATVAVLLVLVCASGASAQRRARRAAPSVSPGVVAELAPYAPTSPPGDPRYLFTLTLRTTTWPDAEVIADRRLLRFEVSDPNSSRARPLTCSHPDAPRFRANPPRARVVGGMNAAQSYREWIDLRMYCTGRALDRAERGGRIVASYGFARAAKKVWVARMRPTTGDAPSVPRLTAGELTLSPRPVSDPSGPPADVSVALAPTSRRTEEGLVLAVGVRSPSGPHMVYLRHDYVRFRIRGPLGAVECGIPPTPLAPIVDLFRPVSPRTATSIRVDARQACRGSFPIAGVYEVAPVVSLPWAFPGNPSRAVTGEFVGEPGAVRITAGGRGYVEHIPEGDTP